MKILILTELLGQLDNANNGFMPMVLLMANVKVAFEIKINGTRSRLEQTPLPQIIDELSIDELPLIIEKKGRVS